MNDKKGPGGVTRLMLAASLKNPEELFFAMRGPILFLKTRIRKPRLISPLSAVIWKCPWCWEKRKKQRR